MLDRPNTGALGGAPSVIGSSLTGPAEFETPPVDTGRVELRPAPPLYSEFGDVGQYIARRAFALIIDLVGVAALFATGIAYLVARGGSDPHTFGAFFATAVYTLFAMIVYLCVSEAYASATLGKALVGLRVRAGEDQPVGIWRGIVRNVFLPFDLLIIGFVLAVITPRRKRIGDFVAGTVVVNAHKPALGVVAAIAILGAWGYAEYAYADGLRTAQTLSNSAEIYAPALVNGQSPLPPAPTPLPDRTPVPTEQPITVPTIAPSGGAVTPSPTPATSSAPAASAAPSGAGTGAPSATASPSAQPTAPDSAAPSAQPSAAASPKTVTG
ncbi:MAG: RDD family protein [Candidatus Eremiobacteraeota bacterium]|nr:RDD family protein [Candidatus Eremiobacteraeota bacterium]